MIYEEIRHRGNSVSSPSTRFSNNIDYIRVSYWHITMFTLPNDNYVLAIPNSCYNYLFEKNSPSTILNLSFQSSYKLLEYFKDHPDIQYEIELILLKNT